MSDDGQRLVKDCQDVHVQAEGRGGRNIRICEQRRKLVKERGLGSFGTCMMRACGVPTFRLHGANTLGSAFEYGNGSM
jgi:hypothetical protein